MLQLVFFEKVSDNLDGVIFTLAGVEARSALELLVRVANQCVVGVDDELQFCLAS